MAVIYALVGLVTLQRARVNRLMDMALHRITLKPTPAVERAAGASLFVNAGLLLTTAAGLVMHSRLGAGAAVAAVIFQGLYLVWADRWYPASHPVDVKTRKGAPRVVAFYGLLAGCAVWLAHAGVLA